MSFRESLMEDCAKQLFTERLWGLTLENIHAYCHDLLNFVQKIILMKVPLHAKW